MTDDFARHLRRISGPRFGIPLLSGAIICVFLGLFALLILTPRPGRSSWQKECAVGAVQRGAEAGDALRRCDDLWARMEGRS